MDNKIIIHQDRSIIEIKGDERKTFIQGLITNDVNKASETNLIYSAMLNPQGRFMYDFFIFEIGDSLIFDCYEPRRDEIFQKLNFYKLRSKVEIVKNDELIVAQSFDSDKSYPTEFKDPRHHNLGNRIYFKDEKNDAENSDEYNFLRICNKVSESERDLTYEKSFILEFGFDELNAIDYQKGCYVGQELTARTHYRGEIRKKLIHIKIDNLQNLQKGGEISCEGKSVGIVLSSVLHEGSLHALALLKLSSLEVPQIKAKDGQDSDYLENNDLKLENNKITIIG